MRLRTLVVVALLVTSCGGLRKRWAKRRADAGASPDAGLAAVAPPASPAVDASSPRPPPPLAKPAGPPADLNVLLVTVDSLRWDMPWNGYARPIAPVLTALEARSVDYTHAYAVSSYTSMSLGGLLAGKLPGELRRDGFFFGTFPGKGNVFFPELLQRAGVRTISAHAHAYFRSAGFQQGFDTWEVLPNIKFEATNDPNVTAPAHVALAEKLLANPELASKRFFAWFHFMDPHVDYISHDPEIPSWGRKRRDNYDAEVAFTDKYVGKLLDFVARQAWAARTAIIVSADHGEALGEHGQVSHAFELWENLVRVPLLFVIPDVPKRRVDVARGALDLAPTICELMGVAPDPGFEGVSLVPEIYGAPAAPRDVALDLPMTSDSDRRRGLLHENLKMIAFGETMFVHFYDLEEDPTEEHKILKGPEYDAMKARYFAFERAHKDVPPYGCLPDVCLNGAYKKTLDGGTK